VWRVYPVEGYYETLANGAKVGSNMLKAAWHWGSDSSVNDPLWNQAAPHYM